MENLDKVYTKKNVGGLVQALRIVKAKMGQVEFAKTLGIPQGTISKIENGILEIRISLMFKIIQNFQLTPNEFQELIDVYIKETLKMQKLNIKSSEQKKMIQQKFSKILTA